MTTTVNDTLLLCNGAGVYDPLHGDTEADLARVHSGEGWVYLQGIDPDASGGTEYVDDLLIVIHDKGWALFWRDPPECVVPQWGSGWCGGRIFEEWSGVVGQAYSL